MFHTLPVLVALDLNKYERQRASLLKVFEHINEPFVETIRTDPTLNDVQVLGALSTDAQADRKEISLGFVNGELFSFKLISWVTVVPLEIDFIPYSTESVEIRCCAQRSEIHARCLPRCAIRIVFSINELFGGIDLQNLPNPLVQLDLAMNNLSGRIFFADLPPKLRWIDLSMNMSLGSRIIYYGMLPNEIQHIGLISTKSRTIQAIDKSFDIGTRRVFVF